MLLLETLVTRAKENNVADIKQNICIYHSQSRGLVSWHWESLGMMLFLFQEQSRNSAITDCFAVTQYFLFSI